MLLIDLRNVRGANPAANPKTLPRDIGADARNLDPTRGDIRGMRGPLLVHTLTGLSTQAANVYRMGREAPSDVAYWLASTAQQDYARSLLASDPTERTYITGGGIPRYTDNTYLGAPPYPTGAVDLGVPAPSATMTLTVATAGTGPNETRTYTDTFLRANLDESAPNTNTASIVVPGGSTVTISGLAAPPSGAHGITLRRIYCSTGTVFQRCVQQLATTTTATDAGTRGAVLETGGGDTKPAWLTPPDDLAGIRELWGGMHGGHHGKAWRVCVPYNPHAWPIEYRRIIPDTIVNTATWGESWLLATTGIPRVVTGTAPAGLVARPVRGFRHACVSRPSVKSVGHGACYSSNEGLCYVGDAGPARVLTDGLLTREQWRALVPSSIIGALWGREYVGFYNDGTRRGCFIIDTVDPQVIRWADAEAYAAWEDPISDSLYLLGAGNTISKWDYGPQLEASYTSAVFPQVMEASPGAARVVASRYPVRLTLWGDGRYIVNELEVFSDRSFRLPACGRAREFQVQVHARGPVEGVFVGTEMADLP